MGFIKYGNIYKATALDLNGMLLASLSTLQATAITPVQPGSPKGIAIVHGGSGVGVNTIEKWFRSGPIPKGTRSIHLLFTGKNNAIATAAPGFTPASHKIHVREYWGDDRWWNSTSLASNHIGPRMFNESSNGLGSGVISGMSASVGLRSSMIEGATFIHSIAFTSTVWNIASQPSIAPCQEYFAMIDLAVAANVVTAELFDFDVRWVFGD